MAFTFSIETMVQGCHLCKEIWEAAIDGVSFLACEREIGNSHNA